MIIKIKIDTKSEGFKKNGEANELFDVLTAVTRNSPFFTFPQDTEFIKGKRKIIDSHGNRCGIVTIIKEK